MNEIYLDEKELDRGNYYRPTEKIRTSDDRSFTLEEWLGRGGNGSVYRCTENATGNEFAIKFLLATYEINRHRFSREIKLLTKLHNAHIAEMHGAGNTKAKHAKSGKEIRISFYVMDLADRSLADLMKDTPLKKLKYASYSGQFRGLATALAELHNFAIHRDIKPENILVSGDRWLLSDYGLCKFTDDHSGDDITGDAQNIGPKYWLSPEAHCRRLGTGDQIDKSSDVFQLAAIFWYVVTGRHPCGILSADDWCGPEKLFPIISKALLHNHSMRPQDGTAFLNELTLALAE